MARPIRPPGWAGPSAVEHVGQLPDKVDLEKGAQHQKTHDQHPEDRHGTDPEEILDVLLREEIPADNGGKSEKEEADRHKTEAVARGAQAGLKGLLVRAMPVVLPSMAPVTKITKAVMFRTTKVSTNTPIMATKPCWAGT